MPRTSALALFLSLADDMLRAAAAATPARWANSLRNHPGEKTTGQIFCHVKEEEEVSSSRRYKKKNKEKERRYRKKNFFF